MLFKYCFVLLFLVSMFYFVGCSPALYKPAHSDETNDVTYSQLLEGRNIYVHKCGSCHSLRLPDKHTEQEWGYYLNKMQSRAKISDEEKKLIKDFLKIGAKKSDRS